MLRAYLKRIYEIANRGDAREETYYSTLESVLSEYLKSIGKKNIFITPLPKKTEGGNPDFRLWDGTQHIVGYIEAKSLAADLDRAEGSVQLERYRQTFPNLILTNFCEFRLYRNGSLRDKTLIGRPLIEYELKDGPSTKQQSDFFRLLEEFLSFSFPRIYDAKNLAMELAKRTRFLKDEVIAQELKEETLGRSSILAFYQVFKEHLIGGLSKEDFADLYSQTITYGLFCARIRSQNGFNRKLAYDWIPHTIGILRDVFNYISLGDLPQQMEWTIDDISEVLAVTDVNNILHQYFHGTKGRDPVVHFYETFLAQYDPKKRRQRGVYYTPEPVVSYIVRSLRYVLRRAFDRADGLANKSVTMLDPAAGTLTFLAEAAKLAIGEFVSKYGEGGKEKFITGHVLKNFYAFELMMAPYTVGHLKISYLLEELGYRLRGEDRFKLYLTNTLEMEELAQTELPGLASLSKESHSAGKVKKETPILVILGNPPYRGISANASEKYIRTMTKEGKEKRKKIKTWIGELIDDYKSVDGEPLGEKNPKWLQDDYVKFIRFAQWKIDKAGQGVLGYITNHGYLDNPTFRGMRRSLMNSFNEIYVLDLHGSSLKKEKCPDGSKDENVFDIKPGVAIGLFIKKRGEEKECRVYHSEIWGSRERKNDWLSKIAVEATTWEKLCPKPTTFYCFKPVNEKLFESYSKYPRITEVLPLHSVGMVTSRDDFVVDSDEEVLKQRVKMFREERIPDELLRERFNLKDKPNWKLRSARQKVRTDANWEDSITEILYRPFDTRWVFYHHEVIERSRSKVMRHMLQQNLGLISTRQVNGEFRHAFCSAGLISDCTISSDTRERSYLFPLHLCADTDERELFTSGEELNNRKPNINPALIGVLSESYEREVLPEETFCYIYALLYSNTYRTKYAEFLRMDFPRIPLTRDDELFSRMAEYGKGLVDLHLLESRELDPPIAKLQGKGNNKVEKLKYDEREKRVYFNQSQYFEGLVKQVWQCRIGGYQVCDKWLKDRKTTNLSLDDIRHYCRIITSLQKTIEIQRAIDDIYPEVEKETILFGL